MDECDQARGADPRLDTHLDGLHKQIAQLGSDSDPEWAARRLAEDLALALQASLLSRVSPPEVAEAFCSSRLGGGGRAYGTLPEGIQAEAIVERALSL